MLELDGNGQQVGRNIYGTNLLMRTAKEPTGDTTYYYMYNGHADVTALLKPDGTIAATYYYDAFGNITESTGDVNNNITYAGYQYDEETKLYYLNARMYDPKIARFLQEDTYTGDPNDPLSLNLYTYCANNPLIYWDPTGHAYGYVDDKTGNFVGYTHWAQVPVGWGISNYSYRSEWASDDARKMYGVYLNEEGIISHNLVTMYTSDAQEWGCTDEQSYKRLLKKCEDEAKVALACIIASPAVAAGAAFGAPEVVVAAPGAYSATTTFVNNMTIKAYLKIGSWLTPILGKTASDYLMQNPDVGLDVYGTGKDVADGNWGNMPMNLMTFFYNSTDYRLYKLNNGNDAFSILPLNSNRKNVSNNSIGDFPQDTAVGDPYSILKQKGITTTLTDSEIATSKVVDLRGQAGVGGRKSRMGNADYDGPLPDDSWTLAPDGEGAHMVERVNVKNRPDLAQFDQKGTPRYYPDGSPENAGQAHLRMHKATKEAGIKLRGGNPNTSDSELIERYIKAYSDPELDGITGSLRTPNNKVNLGDKLTPIEAFKRLIKWGKKNK